jgi:GH15 family glucan-1,4-alpha-glucosidase
VTLHVDDQHLGVLSFDIGEPRTDAHVVSGEFVTAKGSDGLLAVVCADCEPLFLPPYEDLIDHLDRTVQRWEEWTGDVQYDGPWSDAVIRSALALKLLIHQPTGAIAAAATTSLPERIGGEKNWDYRFMWVRDASFTINALMSLGLREEVQATVSYVLAAIRGSEPDLRVFYTLGAETPGPSTELDAPGYRNSRPVRDGNDAADQVQLGTFGDLFDTIWHYSHSGHWLDPDTARMLSQIADRCCDSWRQPDSGIWELEEIRHYTISKIGCWVALDRAVKLADAGALHSGEADRWRREAAEIKAWVDDNCWSETLGSYTFYAGSDELDAATLLAGRTGFDDGERLQGTIAAVRRELAVGPLVYRYTGMPAEEGAFLACTFWLVSALCRVDQHEDANQLMAAALELTNDVGLLSEQVDATGTSFLGNYPQGLSHLALIDAAIALTKSELGSEPGAAELDSIERH